MVNKGTVIEVKFDKEAFAKLLSECGLSEQFLAEIFEVTVSCVRHWKNCSYSGSTSYPSMTNFIKVCNLLDTHPSLYFTPQSL